VTTMREVLDSAVQHARRVKEQHVRDVKGKPGRTDIMTIIESFRGDEPVGVLFTHPDRDEMLKLASIAARGFSADLLAITMETYSTHGSAEIQDNPDTGKRWAPGEMGKFFQKHGPDNGLVSEALFFCAYNRAGDERAVSLPYRIEGRRVIWQDIDPAWDEDGGQGAGVVPNAMRQIMAAPTVQQRFASEHSGLAGVLGGHLTPEGLTASADVATILAIRSLASNDCAIMTFAPPGSERAQVLRERLDRSSVVDPRTWN